MAQIRQKDAIIDSLLKQVCPGSFRPFLSQTLTGYLFIYLLQLHNPYIATPLSIASYRMATSPSDQNNRNVLGWLDQLQASVRDAGQKAGPKAFLDFRNLDATEEDSDAESDSKRTQVEGPAMGDGGRNSTATKGEEQDEEDKLQSSLPDAHVPLGLIADLSLSNSKANRKKEAKLHEDDLDDDNVVCGCFYVTFFFHLWVIADSVFLWG
jgi:hypothetical protein